MSYSAGNEGRRKSRRLAGKPSVSTVGRASDGSVKMEWFDPSCPWQIAEILRIEKATGFVPQLRDELDLLLRRGYLLLLARTRESVVGYLLYKRCQGGREIVVMAVDPAVQRHGVGTLMVDYLKRRNAEMPHPTQIVACVTETRLTAQQFLRANQFRWTQTVAWEPNESVYVMKYVPPAPQRLAETVRECANGLNEHHLMTLSAIEDPLRFKGNLGVEPAASDSKSAGK